MVKKDFFLSKGCDSLAEHIAKPNLDIEKKFGSKTPYKESGITVLACNNEPQLPNRMKQQGRCVV